MQLQPARNKTQPGYPAKDDYFCSSREFLRIAIALGLCTCPLTIPLADSAPKPPAVAIKTQTVSKEKLKPAVDALIAKLGDSSFRVREGATLKLIQVGMGKHSAEKDRAEARMTVVNALKPLTKAKDPEVVVRVRRVIDALTPKQKPQDNVPPLPHTPGW